MAFFPCIYFCAMSQVAFSWGCTNYRKLTTRQKTDKILQRSKNREYFFSLIIKMFAIAKERGIRMIVENPWSEQTFLKSNFILPPSMVDKDRTRRGDFFMKPTAYCCDPMEGYFTEQQDKERKSIAYARQSKEAGLCSEERSMISPDYARNFICDFILGIEQPDINPTLFNTI